MAGVRVPLLLAVCLGTAVFAWRDYQSRMPSTVPAAKIEPRASLAKAPAATALRPDTDAGVSSDNPLAAIELAGLKAWVERPLFAPSRKPPPPPPAKPVAQRTIAVAPVAAPKPAPPRYALIGVVSDGARAIGLLRQEGKTASVMVEIGDTVGGWRVADIRARSVFLQRDDGTTAHVTITPD